MKEALGLPIPNTLVDILSIAHQKKKIERILQIVLHRILLFGAFQELYLFNCWVSFFVGDTFTCFSPAIDLFSDCS